MAWHPRYARLSTAEVLRRQQLVQQLHESRFDSLQRLVGFFVLFHAMGRAVQRFWPAASLGLLGYDMSRSQSIMRVATTASPVSGTEVRDRALDLLLETRRAAAAAALQRAWRSRRMLRWIRRQTVSLSGPATLGLGRNPSLNLSFASVPLHV